MRTRPVVLLLLAAGACTKAAQDAAAQKRAADPKPVRTAQAAQLPLPRTLQVSGTLAADEEAELGFKVQGRIAVVKVDLGSQVKSGDVLAQLDAADFELRVKQSLAALQQARGAAQPPDRRPADVIEPEQIAVVAMARSTLEEMRLSRDRVKVLVAQQLRSDSDLDAAQAALRRRTGQAPGRARGGTPAPGDPRPTQRRAGARAPAAAGRDARGALRRRDPGATRVAGPLRDPGRDADDDRQDRPAAPAPPRARARIRRGQERAGSDRRARGRPDPHSGLVARLAPAIGESSRTLLVEAELKNPDGTLRPGAFARATILVAKEALGLCVPGEALVRFAGIEKVVLFKAGKAEERRVRSGRADQKLVEIVDGLDAGDTVVLAPAGIVTGDRARSCADPRR
jgi:multidrug efflux pump subunit AcrA (membrane-fusion protein)